ncbi:hypothetical protein BJ742DRAFT_464221 [Cladochytrium replicatum]|nr:hypothetical protein BJ742DRAFT_464221 [Cladochytrium replicatum]
MPNLQEPVLTFAFDNVSKMKHISDEDISAMWGVFTKCKDSLENGRRLENMSWRLWYRTTLQGNRSISTGADLSQHLTTSSHSTVVPYSPTSPLPHVVTINSVRTVSSNAISPPNTMSPSSVGRILNAVEIDALKAAVESSRDSESGGDEQSSVGAVSEIPVVKTYDATDPSERPLVKTHEPDAHPRKHRRNEPLRPILETREPDPACQSTSEQQSAGQPNTSDALTSPPGLLAPQHNICDTPESLFSSLSSGSSACGGTHTNGGLRKRIHRMTDMHQLVPPNDNADLAAKQDSPTKPNPTVSNPLLRLEFDREHQQHHDPTRKATFFISSVQGESVLQSNLVHPPATQRQTSAPPVRPDDTLFWSTTTNPAVRFSTSFASTDSDRSDDDSDCDPDSDSDSDAPTFNTSTSLFRKVTPPAGTHSPKPNRRDSALSAALKGTTVSATMPIPPAVDFRRAELTASLRQNLAWEHRRMFGTMSERKDGRAVGTGPDDHW